MGRRPIGISTAPGIAQATYDAAVAKHVTVSDWVDLTAAIVAAVGAGLDADPGTIEASLTCTASTGTFDGATVDCVLVGWTLTASLRDGHGEASYVSLGTIASLLDAAYDPATHGIQLECDVIAPATGETTGAPMVLVGVARGGVVSASVLPCVGASLGDSANTVAFQRALSSAANTALAASQSVGQRQWLRVHPAIGTATTHLQATSCTGGTSAAVVDADTYTTGDTLVLFLGQDGSATDTVSGIKLRFRGRVYTIANIDMSDFEMGAEAA